MFQVQRYKLCFFLSSMMYTRCNRMGDKPFGGAARRRNREDHKKLDLILGGTGASDGLGEGDTAQDFEFPFVRFEDIVAATGNFSEACQIGQGGFGKVYKVISCLNAAFCFSVQ